MVEAKRALSAAVFFKAQAFLRALHLFDSGVSSKGLTLVSSAPDVQASAAGEVVAVPLVDGSQCGIAREMPDADIAPNTASLNDDTLVALAGNLSQIHGFMKSSPGLTRLLNMQLDQTNSTTEAAAVEIMQRLIRVESEAAQLLEKQQAGTDRAALLYRNADVLLQESQRNLAEMQDYRVKREKEAKDIEDEGVAIMRVVSKVGELKSLTSAIQNVTKMTNLLAVNAAIEAARAGQAGKGFSIVADEIRKLSKQIELFAMRIENSIDEVSSSVNVTFRARVAVQQDSAKSQSKDETRWITTLSGTIVQLSEDFQATIGELDTMTRNTYASVSSIQSAIVDVLGQAQFQDTTRQQIEQVQHGLSMWSERIAEVERSLANDVADPLDIEPLAVMMESLSASYTMNSQRHAHLAAIGGKDAAEDERPTIELF